MEKNKKSIKSNEEGFWETWDSIKRESMDITIGIQEDLENASG